MAGPSRQDSYNPTSGAPAQTSIPFNYDTTRASPDSFGVGVGQGITKLGQTASQAADRQLDIEIQKQGILNETMATNAETEAASQYGAISGKYQSMQGLEAVAQLPDTVNQIKQVRQQIRGTLPNQAAQRAFDQLAVRREGFALENANSHSAQQVKAADVKSASASLDMSVDQLSDSTVVNNPAQLNDALANVKFQVVRVLNSQGYGPDAGTGMKMDVKGNLSFDESTEQGRQAKAVADQYSQQALDKAYTNIVKTLASDPKTGNVKTAVDWLDQHKEDISPATYAKLSSSLDGPYRNVQSRDIANQALYTADQTYTNSFSGQSYNGPTEEGIQTILKGIVPGIAVTSGQRNPEHNAEVGGVPNSQHISGNAVDFVLPQGTSFQDFQKQLLASGVKPSELIDEGDHIHLAWGPKGSAKGSGYVSQADYYRMNYDDIVSKARDQAEQQHPDDPAFADQVEARTVQRLNSVIRTQELSVRADQNLILQSVNSSQAPVTSVDQLQNNPDPKVRQAWDNVQLNSPYAAQAIQNRLLTANSKGQASGYGTDFSKHLFDALSGKAGNYSDFLPYVRADHNSPVTNTGLGQLQQTLQLQSTDAGKSFAKAELDFLNNIKSGFVGSMPGVNTPGLNDRFEKQIQALLPRIQAGMAAGKTAPDLFDPKSSDYIGKDVKYPTKAEIIKAQSDAMMSGPQTPKGTMNYSDLDSLKTAVKNDPKLRKQAEEYAIGKGWIQPNPPSIPNSFGNN